MSPTPQPARVTLADAAEQFKAWRESAARPRRIPETLWSLATECAHAYGVSKTVTALGLDYYRLKRRVGACNDGAREQPSPAFVELALDGASRPAGACVVELADGDGRRLRVELPERNATQLASIARALWEAAR